MRSQLSCLFLLWSCASPRAVPSPSVSLPDIIDLGTASYGEVNAYSLLLRNTGYASAQVSIVLSPPFETTTPFVEVAAGADGELVITVEPQGYEPITGSLDMVVSGQAETTSLLQVSVSADGDGDGFLAGEDCDDADPAVNPEAEEIWYDGVDQDCDGASDFDADGDGHDSDQYGGVDCDDTDPAVGPDAEERPNERDDDCDLLVDEHLLVAGDVIFTELLRDPDAVSPPRGQFTEIYNASDRRISLVGFRFTSSLGDATLPDVILSPGDAGVLCVDSDPAVNGGLDCLGDVPYLADDDALSLTAAGVVLDELDLASWPEPVGGISIELAIGKLEGSANDSYDAWCASTSEMPSGDLGSPGDVDPHCP